MVSDLHLFARRSNGVECFRAIQSEVSSAEVLVLNGDIFDFRWSTLPSVEATTDAAAEWLHELLSERLERETHYVLGNHDCAAFFTARLARLAESFPQLHLHRYGARIGSTCFVHGDCAHRPMDGAALRRYRVNWDNDRQLSSTRAKAYAAVDRTGVTRLAHRIWFPRQATIRRIMHYLDHAAAGWRDETRHCYFGHTHLPFSDHVAEGITFHNTGSGSRTKGSRVNCRQHEIRTRALKSLSTAHS